MSTETVAFKHTTGMRGSPTCGCPTCEQYRKLEEKLAAVEAEATAMRIERDENRTQALELGREKNKLREISKKVPHIEGYREEHGNAVKGFGPCMMFMGEWDLHNKGECRRLGGRCAFEETEA